MKEKGIPPMDAGKKSGFPWGMVLFTFICVVVYFYVMEDLGFYFSAFLFFVLITFVLGRRDLNLKKGAVRVGISFVFTAILYILFTIILKVQAPSGLVM